MAYALALSDAGVLVDMRLYALGGHAFEMRPTADAISRECQRRLSRGRTITACCDGGGAISGSLPADKSVARFSESHFPRTLVTHMPFSPLDLAFRGQHGRVAEIGQRHRPSEWRIVDLIGR